MIKISALMSACVLAFSASAANATDFSFAYSYDVTSAMGVFSGQSQGDGSFLITGISGSRTVGAVTTAITGIAPVGTGGLTDNLLYPTRDVPVNFKGITYNLFGGTQINLYASPSRGNVREYVNFASELPSNGSFRITLAEIQSGVPEPATWAMMLVGFGMVGAASRYRRRSTVTTFA